jgi:hypothetical protein
MPKMEFRSNAKPSLYAYPPLLKKDKEALKEKVGGKGGREGGREG